MEPLDVGRDVASFVGKIKATQKMGWGRGHSQGERCDSSAECPGRPSASWVLGQGRLSRSVIREEDPGHAEDGREGGVHAVVVAVVSGGLKRPPPLLYHRVYSTATVFQSQKLKQTPQKKKEKRLMQGPKWNKTPNKKTQTPKKTQRRDMQGYYRSRTPPSRSLLKSS